MNRNYRHTITIYNCLSAADNPDERKEVWYKHVLNQCFYKSVIVKVQADRGSQVDRGVKQENVYTVRIPENVQYCPYREWKNLTSDMRAQYFTLHANDIVVLGECSDEISGVSPDTSAQVLARNKPDAFRVTAVSDNTNSMCGKHYRLGG